MMIFQFVGIQIFSLMYLLLILIVYSSKKRFISAENSIFKILLIFTIFELFLDVATCYTIKYASYVPVLNSFFCKLSMACYQVWDAMLMLYVLLLPSKKNYKTIKELFSKSWMFQVGTIIVFLLAFIMFLFPVGYLYDKTYNISYVVGNLTSYNYAVCITYLSIMLISVVINRNKIPFSKRIPIAIFILTSCIFLPIQRFNKDVPVLIVPLMSFAIMIMYFTLENPDLKLINELNELKKKADESANIKTKILDNVSYNMKTPMNTIVSLSGMLMMEDLPKEASRDVRNINGASKVLLEMVDNTLDISKIEAGVGKIGKEQYNLKDLIRKLYFNTLHSINEEKVKLVLNVDENIPCNLYGDYDKVSKALGNILANAAKYTNVGRINFTINKELYEGEEKVKLIFIISDTGIGIEKKDFDKLYGKFSRIENSETRLIEGTGLGLALSKQIIELLGGKISFDSTYGAGTKFIIELEQEFKDNELVGKIDLLDDSTNKLNKLSGNEYKALIIESNKHDMNVLKRLLKFYNIKVDYALPKKDEVNLIEPDNSQIYDLIFIEDRIINDEVINGVNKVRNDKTILVGISSDEFDSSRSYFYSKGFNECILKPIDIIILDKIINKYLK